MFDVPSSFFAILPNLALVVLHWISIHFSSGPTKSGRPPPPVHWGALSALFCRIKILRNRWFPQFHTRPFFFESGGQSRFSFHIWSFIAVEIVGEYHLRSEFRKNGSCGILGHGPNILCTDSIFLFLQYIYMYLCRTLWTLRSLSTFLQNVTSGRPKLNRIKCLRALYSPRDHENPSRSFSPSYPRGSICPFQPWYYQRMYEAGSNDSELFHTDEMSITISVGLPQSGWKTSSTKLRD